MKNIINWFKDISIKNKLYFIAGIMLFLIALELVTLYLMIHILSATRAYVTGEGLWSKAQKDATISLMRYANTHDEKDYQKYLSFVNVMLADQKARIELQKAQPNYDIVYQGFLDGRNQASDIPGLINLFNWFQHTHYLKKAAALWATDEIYIPKLLAVGNELHQTINKGNATKSRYDEILLKIYKLNSEITVIADDFSYALGEASRWAEGLVLKAVLAIAIIVELSGLLLMVLVTFNIKKEIYEIIRVAKQVRNLNLNERATRYSNDEIGELASSFNKMIEDLQISILKQEKEIAHRKQQEQRLAIRYEITRIMVEKFKLEDAIPTILKTISNIIDLQYGAFWKVDNELKKIVCADIWYANEEKIVDFVIKYKLLEFDLGDQLPGLVWKIRKPYLIKNIMQEPSFIHLELAAQAGLYSGFALPIIFENDVIGVLEFYSNHKQNLDDNLLQMLNDISNLLGIFIQREAALKNVSKLSRLTGMAEVASNVLHNVGNTLNSINISIELLREKTKKTNLKLIVDLNQLLQENKNNLSEFLVNNEKGKHVLEFISHLENEWQSEYGFFGQELDSLNKHVTHVKNIIMTQQSFSHTSGIIDEASIPELIKEAIEINKIAYECAGVEIAREFNSIKPIITDRDKILQILVNIIKNAVDALTEGNVKNRLLTIRVYEKDSDNVVLQFSDNGIGIAEENINKIFTHGFTTKKKGHGFGLHNGALLANELNGSLTVESKGVGAGATFTLVLPYIFTRR